jgi:hypothetical protein
MSAQHDARIWAVIGASGTGKGVFIKWHLKREKPARLLCWDFKNEYNEFAKAVPSLEHMRQAMLKAKGGDLRLRYVPRGAGEKALRKEFEGFCELVYAFGHCTMIAEELANVTTPGWAPGAWRKMTTSGRHEAVHIIGATQTPALVDKSFLGNCTLVHVSALREPLHRMAVARAIDCDIKLIEALPKMHWIERNWDTMELTHGVIGLNSNTVTGQVTQAEKTPPVTQNEEKKPKKSPVGVGKPRRKPRGQPVVKKTRKK